ncbi:hypothetical protein R6Z07F_003483 [Ovis aries]
MLKSSTIIVEISISPLSPMNFCFIHLILCYYVHKRILLNLCKLIVFFSQWVTHPFLWAGDLFDYSWAGMTFIQYAPNGPDAAAAAKSLQSCPTLCNPRDGSPPGSRIPGILQARTLEWVSIPSPMQESEKRK